jgi:hypothetical protein
MDVDDDVQLRLDRALGDDPVDAPLPVEPR